MEGDALQLRDLVPAEPLLSHPGLPWWAWALIGAGTTLLILAVVGLVRRKKRQSPPPLPVDADLAYREAVGVIEESAGLPQREAAMRASGAIRLYLAKVCEDPSLYETHEEFLARHQSLERFPETTREQVSMLLTQLAALKYDRPVSPEAHADFAERPLAVLRQLHQQRHAA